MLNTGKLINIQNYRSLSAWIVSIGILLSAVTIYPRFNNQGTEAVLGWDVFGYYVYLPAAFIYQDMDDVAFLPEMFDKYRPGDVNYYAIQVENGNYVMKYSMGQSVFYLPFFAVGHTWARLSSYEADGMSYPYHFSIFAGALFYSFLGLWLTRKTLLKYFSDRATATALIMLVIGTNYLNYVSFDGAMTHNHLFTLYAGVLYLTIRWHQQPNWYTALGIGLLCGLAALTRPTDAISILIPVLWGVTNVPTLVGKLTLFKRYWTHTLLVIIGAIFIGSWQLIYWKTVSGNWLVYSYEDQGFSFLHPHLINGLFSFRKGWLLYTPMMAFAVWGLCYLYRYHRPLFVPVTVFSLLNLYITFSWDIWWYGGSYGSRAMVQSYAIWMIPFAAFWEVFWRRQWLKWLITPFLVLFIFLNLQQTYFAHSAGGYMPGDGMTMKYYFETYIKQGRDQDLKKYLDNKWEAPAIDNFSSTEVLKHLRPGTIDLNHISTETYDTTLTWKLDNPEEEITINASLPHANKKCWLQGEITYIYPYYEWNEWKNARMIVDIIDGDGHKLYHTSIRLHRLTTDNTWHTTTMDVPLHKYTGADNLVKLSVVNPGKAIHVSNLELRLLKMAE